MKIHFIAIGGSVMHSLAIALKDMGYEISGSDDGIYDPARGRLDAAGLLPDYEGWNPEKITKDLDAIILGMHAFEDNPELKRAQSLGVPIYSYPEFIVKHAEHKQRIVIAGSYGKTTVTAMIMHALESWGKKFDYLVGAQVEGFSNPVRLSEDAAVIVLEGDEYLASKLDPRPKFMLYVPHILVINGISWDHINVFPTEETYVDQFSQLLASLQKGTNVIYNAADKRLSQLVETHTQDDESMYLQPFKRPGFKVKNGVWELKLGGKSQPMSLMGKHNMTNLLAAWEVCHLLGMETGDFLRVMKDFKGAELRMQKVHEDDNLVVIRDYAHAPDKVQATVSAVSDTYKGYNLIACAELHTFSSLNRDYLPLYQDSLKDADQALVFVNPNQFEKRRMDPLLASEIEQAFSHPKLTYLQSKDSLAKKIQGVKTGKDVILLMSSGNLQGLELSDLLAN